MRGRGRVTVILILSGETEQQQMTKRALNSRYDRLREGRTIAPREHLPLAAEANTIRVRRRKGRRTIRGATKKGEAHEGESVEKVLRT